MHKRPGLDMFLEEVHRYCDLYIFTASVKDYADAIIDRIDPKGYIPTSKRFYRDVRTAY